MNMDLQDQQPQEPEKKVRILIVYGGLKAYLYTKQVIFLSKPELNITTDLSGSKYPKFLPLEKNILYTDLQRIKY